MTPMQNRPLGLALILILALALLGCGGDDPASPGDGTPSGDTMDEATAVSQAPLNTAQAVSLVESMSTLVDGVGNKNYGWDANTQMWVYDYNWSQNGYTYNWHYTTQYLDAAGEPQQSADGAVEIIHDMDGTGSYSLNQTGYSYTYSYTYQYDTHFTGLGSGTVTMTASGGTDIQADVNVNGTQQSSSYIMNWETLGDGITWAGGGCPSGTIRYDMNPYHLDVVFHGNGTSTSTLYNGSGGTVNGGGGTQNVSCGL
ncbi:hypothetical protein KDK88_05015 [bacterium]|nr:hypothetical protein [bacterium]